MPNCPLVLIEWLDSVQPQSSWRFLSDIGKPEAIECVSVGWLVADGKKTKSLPPNIGAVNSPELLQVSGLITIPTKAIRRIVRLKEPVLT